MSKETSDLLNQLAGLGAQALAILAPFALAYLTMRLKQWADTTQLKSVLAQHTKELEMLQQFANLAVLAAEQMGAGKQADAKLAEAISYVNGQLKKAGIQTFDEELVRKTIEAQLMLEFNQLKAYKAEQGK